jgi:hypothetical protein
VEGLTEGRIVHFVLDNGEHRPAIVVNVWRVNGISEDGEVISCSPENGCCNLQLFTDGFNDSMPNTVWKTSIVYSADLLPGTWHWIEKA